MRLTALALMLALTAPPTAMAADATTAHPHQGIAPKFSGKPQTPALSAEDLVKLNKGQPVLKQEKGASGGRGIAVQHINASPERVWSRITAYDMYPKWVDNVDECEVYKREGDTIFARFDISAMFVGVEYFIKHTYRPAEGYMTWELDYSRTSDLDDSVGFWIVEPVADQPGVTRVYYSVDVRLSGWVPSAIEDMIAKNGLTKATAWVKRESEKS